jgi:predicted nuclease of predicted toxin-antitoxin system
VRLLLDEMYPAVIASQLRERGRDVVSIHEPEYRRLEGAPDPEVFAAALADGRAIVTENVSDFRVLESHALARGEPRPSLVFTTNRRFPRGAPATIGRLVVALDALLRTEPTGTMAVFLEHADPS